MNKKLYDKLNNTFISLSFILIVLSMIYTDLFNITPQILLLFGSISVVLNGKFKFTKYSRLSFKEQFILGIIFAAISLITIVGTILSIIF
ncbi:MAG: hypothetical protein SOV85_02050 [Clostridium sp.]|uniref:hypothetical protein n=1 Tax=Clostridium sp. TaxID=1506 RepID=UPI002A761E51|nr:hypothetical protein [Clostridium sp.]MDY2630126.1 hypothetical protein [Clostridium sp.]